MLTLKRQDDDPIQSKMLEDHVVIYDVNSIPPGLQLAEVVHAFMDTGILLWDSNEGCAPIVSLYEPKEITFKQMEPI